MVKRTTDAVDNGGTIPILEGPGNWIAWHESIQDHAIAERYWNLTSGNEELLTKPVRPTRPSYNEASYKVHAGEDTAVAEVKKIAWMEAKDEYEAKVDDFERADKNFEKQDALEAAARSFLLDHVTPALRGITGSEKTSHEVYEVLKGLCGLPKEQGIVEMFRNLQAAKGTGNR
jgi:hypothetical protein